MWAAADDADRDLGFRGNKSDASDVEEEQDQPLSVAVCSSAVLGRSVHLTSLRNEAPAFPIDFQRTDDFGLCGGSALVFAFLPLSDLSHIGDAGLFDH